MNRHILVGCAVLNSVLLLNYLLWYVGASFLASWVCVPALLVAFMYLLFCVARHEPFLWPIPVFLLALLLVSLTTPTAEWDARSIWLFHAKRIFLDDNLFAQLDGYAPWSHNDYPVIIPALSASMAGLLGVWNEVYPKTANIFFLIAPLYIVGSVLRRSISIVLYVCTLIYVCSHYLHNGFADANVAVIVSSLSLMVFGIDAFNGRHKIVMIYILATSLSVLCLIKNEGIMLYVIFVILLAAFSFFSNLLSMAQVLLVSVVPALSVVTWKIKCQMHNVNNDLTGSDMISQILIRIFDVGNLISIWKSMFNKFFAVSILIIVLCMFIRKLIFFRVYALVCVCFAVLYSGVVFLIYLSTPNDLNWHLSTSAMRVMMSPNMVVVGGAMYILTSLYENLFLDHKNYKIDKEY